MSTPAGMGTGTASSLQTPRSGLRGISLAFFFFPFSVLRMKPRLLYMPGKSSMLELHPSTLKRTFKENVEVQRLCFERKELSNKQSLWSPLHSCGGF